VIVKNIIAMLQLDDFYNESYNIQIAKGLYSNPTSYKEIWKAEKRRRILKDKVRKLEKKISDVNK
jgi:hypothetical protein